jgi:hypothetical protein
VIALEPQLSERLLEELIYERVRTQVDLMQLGWFEADLDMSIRRVLAQLERDGGDTEPSSVLAGALIDRAWQRLEAEWQRTRGEPDPECPVCLRSLFEEEKASAAAKPKARKAVAR